MIITLLTHIDATDVDMGSASISWKKTYHGAEKPERTEGEVLAISAFMMSALPTPLARKALVKEMWESGAETIVNRLRHIAADHSYRMSPADSY